MHSPRKTNTQFSLRSLLMVITVFAAMFGFLSAMGVSPRQTLVGLAVLGTVSALLAIAIEATYRTSGLR